MGEQDSEDLDHDEEDDEEDDDEGDDDDDDEEEDEEDEDSEDEGDEEEEDEKFTRPPQSTTKPSLPGNLDPIAAIKASKAKDIEKGRAIIRQQVCYDIAPQFHIERLTLDIPSHQAFFDDALALRISFQKVFTSSQQIINARKRKAAEMGDADEEDEDVSRSRRDALKSLATLNERMFSIRHVRFPFRCLLEMVLEG